MEKEEMEKEKQAEKEKATNSAEKMSQPKINQAINNLTKCDLNGVKQTNYT